MHSGKIDIIYLKYLLREGIVEGTDLATLAHLEDPVLLRGSGVSMRVARASASLLSSLGRVPGTSPG